eukprot:1884105-Rhodomonas_salina.1
MLRNARCLSTTCPVSAQVFTTFPYYEQLGTDEPYRATNQLSYLPVRLLPAFDLRYKMPGTCIWPCYGMFGTDVEVSCY